jgi:hypothetical protein
MVQIALIVWTIAGIAYGSLLAKWHGELMGQLRAAHQSAWRDLGSPHNAWGGWTWRTLRFLLSGHFERLHDPSFSAAAARFRVGFLIWSVGSSLMVLVCMALLNSRYG